MLTLCQEKSQKTGVKLSITPWWSFSWISLFLNLNHVICDIQVLGSARECGLLQTEVSAGATDSLCRGRTHRTGAVLSRVGTVQHNIVRCRGWDKPVLDGTHQHLILLMTSLIHDWQYCWKVTLDLNPPNVLSLLKGNDRDHYSWCEDALISLTVATF